MVWTTIDDKDEDVNIPGRCVPGQQLEAVMANTMLDHLCLLNISSRAPVERLSGIICVIGAASREPEVLEKMIEMGMNIACLNFSHGSQQYHAEVLENIKTATANYNKKIRMKCPLGIALITKGPEIRTGFPIGGRLEFNLDEGDTVQLTSDVEYIIKADDPNIVHVNYDNLHNILQVGNQVYIDNKRIFLECTSIEGLIITCRVMRGGYLRTRKRVHLPGIQVDLPALSDKDRADLRFAIEHDVDMIFASYVRSADAVKEIRDTLGPDGSNILIISQIENQQGLDNVDDIIKASDGIIVSRGDLGNEMDQEEVFLAQKSIIAKCNKVGKPVICTTQMLESMVKHPRPTRAERCDVANAVLDGADGIMLNHETAIGDYPVKSIRDAARICKQAEAAVWQRQLVIDITDEIIPPIIAVHAVATAAVRISLQLLASAIVVVTASVKSAQLLTKYRPKCPVIAVTRNAQKARQAHLYRGILPLQYKVERATEWVKDLNLRVYYGINFGRKKGFIRPGDPVVVMTGSKQKSGFADKMKILYVTKHISHGTECIC
ncbi:pyruvate kinase-like isoform X2 [Tenebrio molitor]|uniref:pyruvate kinase-like isoform X2 n=1 Tax=Tenebrio molitor TaxID=7067 RepID=UPI00362496A9